ncbi:MAG: hypothetical protein HY370_04600 [Proteobacteria bacterium]|nr:hypothetical protein [Pseudomonadota bacterium]
MPFINFRSFILLTGSCVVLSGCGDGWEMRPYEGVPYEMERTAGRGVEYVRANMARAKGPELKTEMKEEVRVTETKEIDTEPPPQDAKPEPVIETSEEPVNDAAAVFNEKQKK